MVNKVILIGNLGQDPEVRSTQSGQSVASLRVATTERRKDRDGNWGDHTEWHSVVVWGNQADNVAKYCKKGKQLFIEGRLQTRKWQDKEGKDRWSTEIVADVVRFLGGGPREEGGGYQGGGGGGGYQGGGGGGYQGGGGGGRGGWGGGGQGGGGQGGGGQGGGGQGGGSGSGGGWGGNQGGGRGGPPPGDDVPPFPGGDDEIPF